MNPGRTCDQRASRNKGSRDGATSSAIHTSDGRPGESGASSTLKDRNAHMGQFIENYMSLLRGVSGRQPMNESHNRANSAGCQKNIRGHTDM